MNEADPDIVPTPADDPQEPIDPKLAALPPKPYTLVTYDLWGRHRLPMTADAANDMGVTFCPAMFDELAGRLRRAAVIGEYLSLRHGWKVVYSASFGKLAIFADVYENETVELLAQIDVTPDEVEICPIGNPFGERT